MITSLNYNSSFLTSKNAMEILGVSIVTLRKWAKDGTINTIRTSGNHRLYDVKSYLRECENQKEGKNNDTTNDTNNDVKNILRKSINKSHSKIKKIIESTNDNDSSDEEIDLDDNKVSVCYIRATYDNNDEKDNDEKDKFNKNKEYLQKKYKNYTIIEDKDNCMISDLKRPGLMKILNLALDKKISNLVILNKDNLSSNNFDLIEYILKRHSKCNIINENKLEPSYKSTSVTLDKIINIIGNYKNNLEN
jgi:predicted site-specific integrase-resolvase